jgi:hypothetical protein
VIKFRIYCFLTLAVSILFTGLNLSAEQQASQLELAIKNHDHQQLKLILNENPLAWQSEKVYIGDIPAGLAVKEANLVALKLFVENGYPLNPDDWYQHPIRLINPYLGHDSVQHLQMLEWILSQIGDHPYLNYHLLAFVETEHYLGAEILLKNGADPNTWVRNWHSALDLTDDEQMKELLESYGGGSNFQKLMMFSILAFVITLMLIRFILKPKQSIADNGHAVSPERNLRKGKIFHIVGMVILLISAFGMLSIRFATVFGGAPPDQPFILYGLSIALFGFGIQLVLSGRKLKTIDAQAFLDNTTRTDKPIFVYLRSFKLDEQDASNKVALPGGLSFAINPWEGGLASAFQKVGELIAIGKPGEKLATLGASRLYVTDDQWQEKVLEMVKKSELVVWTYGDTEGLRWEIARLVEIVPPEKLVIAMPFWDKKMAVRKAIWQQARDLLGKNFKTPLPENVGDSLFLTFDQNWKSKWVETIPPSLLVRITCLGFWSPIAKGVESLLQARGYHYPKLTYGEKLFFGFFALLGWVLVATIAVMLYGLVVAFT